MHSGQNTILSLSTMASEHRPSGLRQPSSSSITSTSGLLPQAHQSKPQLSSQTDTKPRGANRSTKVAGKLKVLPDQVEGSQPISVPSLVTKGAAGSPSQSAVVTVSSSAARPESIGTTAGGVKGQHRLGTLVAVQEEEAVLTPGGTLDKTESASDDEEGDGDVEEDEELDIEELDAEVSSRKILVFHLLTQWIYLGRSIIRLRRYLKGQRAETRCVLRKRKQNLCRE